MSNVINISGKTFEDIDTDVILEKAQGKLNSVIVIGKCNDGEYYFASSSGYSPDLLWDLKQAELHLIDNSED